MTDVTKAQEEKNTVKEWWDALDKNPGGRAMLRRANSTVEAATLLPTLDLIQRIPHARSEEGFKSACNLARILAWIKEDDSQSLIQIVGWPEFPSDNSSSDSRPKLSDVQFRRLMRVETQEGMATMLIRIIRLADGRASIRMLARDFTDWSIGYKRETVRTRWAYTYYNAVAASPPSN